MFVPSGSNAQTYRGKVVEAGSGRLIEGVLLRGSPGGYVDVTLEDGVFEFVTLSAHKPLAVVVSRQGYVTETFVLDEPSQNLVLELSVSPIQLEGVSTVLTLEEQLEQVEQALDNRYGPHRGIFRALRREEIRAFDDAHRGDPYAMLTAGLDLYSDIQADQDVLRTPRGRRLRFEVFVDDVELPLRSLLDIPNDQLCRAEMFHTDPMLSYDILREPTPQLRVYTCSFMARVATGQAELSDRVCWNRLRAWKPPTSAPSGCTYRR